MLGYCKETGLSLSGMVMQNELALHSKKRLKTILPTSGRPCAPVSIAG
jgi:L-serine deaminase